ncbi:hypothetical protein L1887_08238 [Cichorium endivia]|nr:hypothetical protein L1887_08238 [Cichorium endivia]
MAKTVVSTIGSVAAAAMVVRSFARDYLPAEYQEYLYFGFRNFINKFSTQLTMVIHEFDGFLFLENEIYKATELYLAARISPEILRLKITKRASEKNIKVSMETNEEFTDVYNGVKFRWSLVSNKAPTTEYYRNDVKIGFSGDRMLELTFHRKHKELALNEYLPFILEDSKKRKQEEKSVKLFTVDPMMMHSNGRSLWTSVNLDHPANFDTLAMDTDVKEKVMMDLDRFIQRRDYYRKVGKAWKRGYLLYGPPGTGKSSLIAAMANYLKFDIYDLELTDIRSNLGLRKLLVATANRSILVVEDIDCSVELHDRVGAEAAAHRVMGYKEERVSISKPLLYIYKMIIM